MLYSEFILTLFVVFFSRFSTFVQLEVIMKTLEGQIIDTLSKQKRTLPAAFIDLSSDEELLINQQENFYASSSYVFFQK